MEPGKGTRPLGFTSPSPASDICQIWFASAKQENPFYFNHALHSMSLCKRHRRSRSSTASNQVFYSPRIYRSGWRWLRLPLTDRMCENLICGVYCEYRYYPLLEEQSSPLRCLYISRSLSRVATLQRRMDDTVSVCLRSCGLNGLSGIQFGHGNCHAVLKRRG